MQQPFSLPAEIPPQDPTHSLQQHEWDQRGISRPPGGNIAVQDPPEVSSDVGGWFFHHKVLDVRIFTHQGKDPGFGSGGNLSIVVLLRGSTAASLRKPPPPLPRIGLAAKIYYHKKVYAVRFVAARTVPCDWTLVHHASTEYRRFPLAELHG